jgi:hypothetical protein
MSKMPIVHIKENIRQIHEKMNEIREEILRLEGVLRTFEGFEKAGLTKIDLPQPPVDELESIQEKPE